MEESNIIIDKIPKALSTDDNAKDQTNNQTNDDTKDNTNDDKELISIVDNDLMLTTMDNPYSPKTEYEMWKFWDNEHNYYTEELLARFVDMDFDDMLDENPNIIDSIIMNAMIFIAENNPQQVYKLV